MLMKAETLFAEDKPTEAADVYRDIDSTLLSEKNRRGMLYQRGRCLAEAKDPEGAIKSLTDFITKYPDDERVMIARATRATAYATTGQSGLAIADFQKDIDNFERSFKKDFLQTIEAKSEPYEIGASALRLLSASGVDKSGADTEIKTLTDRFDELVTLEQSSEISDEQLTELDEVEARLKELGVLKR
jgi:tetratricopeptide (TPR) repeat protein